jgi:hypothetical protein
MKKKLPSLYIRVVKGLIAGAFIGMFILSVVVFLIFFIQWMQGVA